jgi:hypothetical protein
MKTTIISSPWLPVLPCILKSRRTNLIIFFIGETAGTVLDSGTTGSKVGDFSKDWDSIYDSKTWEAVPDITINFKL